MEVPGVNTKWNVTGTAFRFQIVDIWSTGSGDNYRRTMYELKYEHTTKIQYLEANRLHELITDSKIELINN